MLLFYNADDRAVDDGPPNSAINCTVENSKISASQNDIIYFE